MRAAGFDGPYSGTKHDAMAKGAKKVPIPNAHEGDIGTPLLARILRQAAISREEWERL